MMGNKEKRCPKVVTLYVLAMMDLISSGDISKFYSCSANFWNIVRDLL